MTNTTDTKRGPVEVWLRQQNLQVCCSVVGQDESVDLLDLGSLSMRGAQREITGDMIRAGYKPDGRWTIESVAEGDDETFECSRRFKPSSS